MVHVNVARCAVRGGAEAEAIIAEAVTHLFHSDRQWNRTQEMTPRQHGYSGLAASIKSNRWGKDHKSMFATSIHMRVPEGSVLVEGLCATLRNLQIQELQAAS